jgi:hypothetical protein
MAWALLFDGVNDYLTFPVAVGNGVGVAGDDNQHWELVITQDLLQSSTYVYRPIESSTVSRVEVLFRVSDGLVRFVSPTSGTYQWAGTGINSDVNQEIKFIKPAGVRRLDLYVNGVFFASDTGGDNSCLFDVYGKNSGAGYVSGNLTQLKFTDFITSANDRNFDPTASSHAAGTPILTDTIGGNNATGVNMPTDGSAWIDLGGGGISIAVDSGGYSYAGTDARLIASRVLKADAGSYLYTGSAASLLKGFVLTASSGSYSYLGQDATLTYTPAGAFILAANSGNYTYTGSNVNFNRDRVIIASSGTYNYNGTGIQIILPGQIWTDKPSASTNWNNQTVTTTIWTDK